MTRRINVKKHLSRLGHVSGSLFGLLELERGSGEGEGCWLHKEPSRYAGRGLDVKRRESPKGWNQLYSSVYMYRVVLKTHWCIPLITSLVAEDHIVWWERRVTRQY